MKRKLFTLLAMLLLIATAAFGQDKMEVKDADSNLLMQVNDEGATGSVSSGSFNAGAGTTYGDGAINMAGGTDLSIDGNTLFVDNANNRVGIGTNSPATGLHVASGGIRLNNGLSITSASGAAIFTGGLGGTWSIQAATTTGNILQLRAGDGSERIRVDAEGNVGIRTGGQTPNILTVLQNSATDPIADAWTTYSSRRWKTNIQTIDNALETVQKLRGVTYDWKATGKHDIGLIAEEVGEVIPEIVAYEENGVDAKSVDYARLVAVLIEAVKAQQGQIASYEKRFAQIEMALQKMTAADGKSQFTSTK